MPATCGRSGTQGKAVTGQGVTVAVLDSGVANVEGLNGAGQDLHGPDLSLETNSRTCRGVDTFGHGTHLAGIIAADDPTAIDPKTGRRSEHQAHR